MHKKVLSVSTFLMLIYYSNAVFNDCGSLDGKIESLQVSNCAATARRCILRRNTNATIDITFTPNSGSDALKAVVHGIIMGAALPFNLPNPDGCKDSGIICPIQSNTAYKYTATLPILSAYPRVTVDIKYELQDGTGKNIICALIPAKIG